MSYAVAVRLAAGLILAADCRTNAGIDQVSTFRKMHLFGREGERQIVLLTAGNLSITQNVIGLLREAIARDESGPGSLLGAPSLFACARLVGGALRETYRVDGEAMSQQGAAFEASFLLGGQVRGEEHRLFQIYAPGNFIEAGEETPFFQIGETKYGKPILDRMLRPDTPLDIAAKCVLVSFDSTMRSNVSVGPPIDIACYAANSFHLERRRLAADDPYLLSLSRSWAEGLRLAFDQLPDPDWLREIGRA